MHLKRLTKLNETLHNWKRLSIVHKRAYNWLNLVNIITLPLKANLRNADWQFLLNRFLKYYFADACKMPPFSHYQALLIQVFWGKYQGTCFFDSKAAHSSSIKQRIYLHDQTTTVLCNRSHYKRTKIKIHMRHPIKTNNLKGLWSSSRESSLHTKI